MHLLNEQLIMIHHSSMLRMGGNIGEDDVDLCSAHAPHLSSPGFVMSNTRRMEAEHLYYHLRENRGEKRKENVNNKM